MRRIILLVLTVLVLMPFDTQAGIGTHQTKSKEQKYAEKKSRKTFREWGSYEGFSSMDLEGFAASVARKKLAERVGVYVEPITANYLDAVDADSINEKTGKDIKDNEAQQRAEGNFKLSADAFIRNSRVVMTDRYVQNDGTVVCYAAVEVSIDDVEAVVMTTKAMRKAFKEAGIDVDSPEFEKAAKDTRKKYASGNLDLQAKKLDISNL